MSQKLLVNFYPDYMNFIYCYSGLAICTKKRSNINISLVIIIKLVQALVINTLNFLYSYNGRVQ